MNMYMLMQVKKQNRRYIIYCIQGYFRFRIKTRI